MEDDSWSSSDGDEESGASTRLGNLATLEVSTELSQRPIHCGFCPKIFRRRDNRENHIRRVHKSPTSRECSFCGEYYKNDMALVRHINNSHANQKKPTTEYQPTPRGKSSGRGRRSSTHASPTARSRPLTHKSVADPTQCQFCGITFRGAMDRRKHELTHFPVNGEMTASSSNTMFGDPGPSESNDGFGISDPENVFIPLELMMKANEETSVTTTKAAYKEVVHGSDDPQEITATPVDYIPQTLDEFMNLL